MTLRPLSPTVSVSAQLAPGDMPALAAAGFGRVISNRPDGEDPGQPSAAAMEAAARDAGLDFVWSLVKENKGHMDRARYLSLTHGARTALDEHRLIMAALRARDPARAAAAVRQHLSRIEGIIARLRVEQPGIFDS